MYRNEAQGMIERKRANGQIQRATEVYSVGRLSMTCRIADTHRDGKRFIVRADEKLTAFLELERVVCRRLDLAKLHESSNLRRARACR
jgi:hypothetical protein